MAPPAPGVLGAMLIPQNNLQEEIPLPESTDDYAKALREAYRRGAEAAARLQQQQPQMSASCPNLQHFQGQPNNPTVAPAHVPNPLVGPVPPPAPMPPPPPPPRMVQQVVPASAGSRSLSLPDMQSYAARAQAEEEKRKKRLARNRASARLRRLRKKNLVDSYEGEVGVLEASLQKLKAHTWGTSHEALLEALSMERGQQELSNEERVQLIQDIVQQQRKQVEFLRETQREQEVLLSVVENPEDELSIELQSVLNLTDEQKEDIRKACRGLEKEVQAMETFIQCLDAMQDKAWLWNEGVAQISNQFTSILHTNQLSKFLLWADGNSEALDSLEYCHAPPSQAPPASAPIFVFGMDDHASQVAFAQGDSGE